MESKSITVYEKSTCTKCREVKKILDEARVSYNVVEYHKAPLSHKKLTDLILKIGCPPADLVRRGEKSFKSLGVSLSELSDKEIIKLLVYNPDILQRPIIEKGDKAVIGRPPENVKVLL